MARKILLVEDDRWLREGLAQLFFIQPEGWNTDTASSVKEAIQKLQSEPCYNLVILDNGQIYEAVEGRGATRWLIHTDRSQHDPVLKPVAHLPYLQKKEKPQSLLAKIRELLAESPSL